MLSGNFSAGDSLKRDGEFKLLDVLGDLGVEHFDFLLLLKKPLSSHSSSRRSASRVCVSRRPAEFSPRRGASGNAIVGLVWWLLDAKSSQSNSIFEP